MHTTMSQVDGCCYSNMQCAPLRGGSPTGGHWLCRCCPNMQCAPLGGEPHRGPLAMWLMVHPAVALASMLLYH
jgi:hypothetical protein